MVKRQRPSVRAFVKLGAALHEVQVRCLRPCRPRCPTVESPRASRVTHQKFQNQSGDEGKLMSELVFQQSHIESGAGCSVDVGPE